MVTYIVLNIIAVAIILITLRLTIKHIVWNRAITVALVVLFFSTAVFDSMIVSSNIVAYDDSLILGLRIGSAPIEDFFYIIAAALVVPSVWHANHNARRHDAGS